MPQSSQLVAIPVQLRHGSEERWLLENWHAARSRAQKKGSCEIQLWPLLCADLGLSEHSTRCQECASACKKRVTFSCCSDGFCSLAVLCARVQWPAPTTEMLQCDQLDCHSHQLPSSLVFTLDPWLHVQANPIFSNTMLSCHPGIDHFCIHAGPVISLQ